MVRCCDCYKPRPSFLLKRNKQLWAGDEGTDGLWQKFELKEVSQKASQLKLELSRSISPPSPEGLQDFGPKRFCSAALRAGARGIDRLNNNQATAPLLNQPCTAETLTIRQEETPGGAASPHAGCSAPLAATCGGQRPPDGWVQTRLGLFRVHSSFNIRR